MRVLVLLITGEHYILDEEPLWFGRRDDLDAMLRGELVLGGKLFVPRENVAAVEVYEDCHIALFRLRLAELRA